MLPGERISLIKGVAAALAEEKWPDMDLTLRQFGFETYGEDGFNVPPAYEYAIDRLESKGSDDALLLEIQDYMFPGLAAGNQTREGAGGPWQPEHFRLFVSHTNAHRSFLRIAQEGVAQRRD